MKLRDLFLLTLIGMTGCSFSGGAQPERYQLQPTLAENETHRVTGHVLRVIAPHAASHLDNDHIQLQQSDGTVSFIQNAAWSEPPANMLMPLLTRSVDQAGLFKAVVDDSATANVALELQTTVERFTVVDIDDHAVAGPNPHIEMALRINLVNADDNHLLMSKVISTQAPLAEVRLSAIIAAFNQALGSCLADVNAAMVQSLRTHTK